MTKQKSTKRALLMSGLALLMCVSMLIGSTYAWFTDTASTAVNKIQSGTLDVALEMWDGEKWVDAEGETLDFVKAEGHENEQILWEPGCTYELPALRIINKGNLALKFAVGITGITGDAKLNEVIDWTITYPSNIFATEEYKLGEAGRPGSALSNASGNDGMCTLIPEASLEFKIKGHMQETAGNEYQNLTIEGIGITVVATQLPYEYDSYDRDYDYDATLPSFWDGKVGEVPAETDGVIHITTAQQLAALMSATQNGNSPYAGKTFVLDRDIDFAGKQITGIGGFRCNIVFTFDGNGHTISNFVINGIDDAHKEPQADGSIEYRYAGLFQQFTGTVKNLTVRNATIIGDQMVGVIAANVDDGGKIENCKVYDSVVIGAKKVGAIAGYSAGASCTVTDCYAENVNVYASDSRAEQSAEMVGYVGAGSSINNEDPVNVNVYRGIAITPVSTAAELKDALLAGGTVILTKDIDMDNAWETANVQNKDLTLNGNGHTIKNLNAALLNLYGGTFNISNLTVKDSVVTAADGVLGAGIILEQAQWANLYMDNCHVANCSLTAGDTRAAAIVGYWIGGGEIKNCTVDNFEVSAKGSAAGIVGHRAPQGSYEAKATIVDCSVTNSTIKATDDGWRIGTAIGTSDTGTVTVERFTASNNTLQQTKTDGTPETDPLHPIYGRVTTGGSVEIK